MIIYLIAMYLTSSEILCKPKENSGKNKLAFCYISGYKLKRVISVNFSELYIFIFTVHIRPLLSISKENTKVDDHILRP